MSNSPLILSIETATVGGSVWLGRGDVELAAAIGDQHVSQSNSLLRDIDQCLKKASVSLEQIDVFACASGPGSFTGLRIGIATLKALAATLNRACVGIPTLQAVAHAAGISNVTVALLPAGRGEVFAQMFSVAKAAGEIVVESVDTAAHLSPQKLIEKYSSQPNLIWAGPGAQLQRAALEAAAANSGISFVENSNDETSADWRLAAEEKNLAKHVAALAWQAFQKNETQLPEMLHAIYVRPSDAELNLQHK